MNFSKIKLKLAMIAYATKHKLVVPPIVAKVPLWGTGARTLAWRVSTHIREHGKKNIPQSAQPTLALAKALGVPVRKPFKIQKTNLSWAGTLSKRYGPPRMVVWHHEDANDHDPHDGLQDVYGVHAYHKSLGWLGFAYHFFVAFDGTIYQGRPEWAFGGHAKGCGDCIGVVFEGDYEQAGAHMPKEQLEAGKELHRYLWKKYHKPDIRHRDCPGNSTACPGQSFPYAAITSAK